MRSTLWMLVVFVSSLFISTSGMCTENPKPDQEHDWIAVSYPCAIDTAELRKLGIIAMSWESDAYKQPKILERGKGYFLSPVQAVPPVSVCESAPQNYPVVWQFRTGWNLIGNPLNEPISINKLFLYDSSYVNEVVAADATGLQNANKDYIMQPGQACWVYLDNDARTNIARQWVYVDIKSPEELFYVSSEIDSVSDGLNLPVISQSVKHVQLTALARQTQKVQYENITESAEWITSDPAVATVDKGLLHIHAQGIVKITARYKDSPEDHYSIRIVDGHDPVNMRFNVGPNTTVSATSSTKLQVFATFLSGTPQCQNQNPPFSTCTVDITSDVELTIDNPKAGRLQGNNFIASINASTARITAIYKKTFTSQTRIQIRAFSWDDYPIRITRTEPYPPQCGIVRQNIFAAGQQGTLQLQNTENTNIQEKLEWIISPPGFIEMQENTINTLTPGDVNIRAKFHDQISEPVQITIKPQDEPMCITANPSNSILVPSGASVSLSATAYYVKAACNQDIDPSEFCSRDISQEVAWALSNPSRGHLYNSTFLADGTPGQTSITGDIHGTKLPTIPVTIIDSQFQFLEIHVSGAHSLEQCPVLMTEGDINGCYSLMTGRDINLEVMGKLSGNMHITSMYLSESATWTVSNPSIARIRNSVLTPLSPGLVWVQAHVGDTSSPRIQFMILGSNPMRSLLIGTQYAHTYGDTRKLPADICTPIVATMYTYGGGCDEGSDCTDVTAENVTREAAWIIEDPAVVSIIPRILPNPEDKRIMNCIQPIRAGQTQVRATYQDLTSNTQNLEIWSPKIFPGCASSTQSLAQWSDRYSSANMQTCAAFGPGEPVIIQYKAWLEDNAYYIDTCLDLFITDKQGNIVKTLREEGCTTENVAKFAARRQVYDHLATWNRLDDKGDPVAPGRYNAVARFAILYDPVISVPFQLIDTMDTSQ